MTQGLKTQRPSQKEAQTHSVCYKMGIQNTWFLSQIINAKM